MPALDRWMQRVIDTGLACAECGTEFTEPHGHKVVCTYCGRRMRTLELSEGGLAVATHPEKNRAAHADEARARKDKSA